MSSLVFRQYRAQAVATLGLLAALAALLVVTGLQMAGQWHSALVTCAATRTCGNLSSTLFLGSHAVGFLVIMTLGVPLVLGILCGAPLVAHEFETGTNQFAWTQAITRRRWLAVKAGWLLLAAAAVGGIVSALVTWWSGPNNALQGNAFETGRFDIMGVVPVAYALFAMALGIAAGAMLRRTVPAIGLTVAGYIAVRILVTQWLRPHFLTAVTHAYGLMQNWAPTGAAWQFAQGILTPDGRELMPSDGTDIGHNVQVFMVPASCHQLLNQANPGPVLSCMQSAGFRQFVSYQPGSRYWAFQGIEAGIFVALAVALLAVAYAVIARRDG